MYVELYGYIRPTGYAINTEYTRILIGRYTKNTAIKILQDNSFMNRWNNEHPANIEKLSIEWK
jgi:hypothetical protein